MAKSDKGAAAGGGALYALDLRCVVLLLAAGRLVLEIRLGDLPQGGPLAGGHGLRGV